METLATAEVKLERASKHHQTALEHKERAMEEAKRCRVDVDEMRKLMRPKNTLQRPQEDVSHAQTMTARTMASLLTSLRQTATFLEDGRVALDPAGLEGLASQVKLLASPAKPTRQQEDRQAKRQRMDSTFHSIVESPEMVLEGEDEFFTENDPYSANGEASEFSDAALSSHFSGGTSFRIDPGRTAPHGVAGAAQHGGTVPVTAVQPKQRMKQAAGSWKKISSGNQHRGAAYKSVRRLTSKTTTPAGRVTPSITEEDGPSSV